MVNPPFIVMTIAVLAAALLIRPKSQKLRYFLRLPFVLLGIFMWAYNTGFFISWWGYAGNFPTGFGLYCLPLCVALFPQRLLRNTFLFTALYVAIVGIYMLKVVYSGPPIGLNFPDRIGQVLLQDIRAYLFLAASVIVIALPGLIVVWLCNGGSQQIERWHEARKAQRMAEGSKK